MKMRWSDGHSFAVDFIADSPTELMQNGAAAISEFRIKTARHFHDGKEHKNKIHYKQAEFQIEHNGKWWHTGHIEKTGTGLSYFHSNNIVLFPVTIDDTYEAIAEQLHQDTSSFVIYVDKISARIQATQLHLQSFETLAYQVGDQLPREN